MTIYVVTGQKGFITEGPSGLPEGAVEITDDLHRELLEGQELNKSIDFSVFPPMLIDPVLSPEQQAIAELRWRDIQLADTDGAVGRHRDERDMGKGTTLTSDQFSDLLLYRQDLRDWPANEAFPATTGRPVTPDWLTA